MKLQTVYPFPAIVGQDRMKLALILNVINPRIGGVLIRGEKGTAKSTAVRALADLLPQRGVAQDCPFGCIVSDVEMMCDDCRARREAGRLSTHSAKMRVVDLPISATEDRVAGTLDIEHTLKTGEKRFEPGVLAQANGNILYVDEVNLMDDHIVDILLDAAAMGVNFVEREGISFTHPASFVLVGTMNPEEGDLRPQLLDRFGLVVEVTGEQELAARTQVIKRRLAFEANPEGFAHGFQEHQTRLADEIERAKHLLARVDVPDSIVELAARIAIELGVDGHRADITTIKTAQTLSALHGREQVGREEILEAAQLALPHRLRRRPLEDETGSAEQLSQTLAEILQ